MSGCLSENTPKKEKRTNEDELTYESAKALS